MPISAVFTADFSAWNKALKDATASFQPLEIKSKSVQQELARMARSLNGEAIIKQASLAAAAIGKIENVAKLTTKEAARFNAVMVEAIEKATKMGDVVPQEWRDIAAATTQATKATTDNAASFKGLVASYAAGLATFEGAKRVIGGISDFLASSLESYGKAEAASKRLTVALQATGNSTPKVIGQMNALATEFQNTTTFSDDLITEMEALFTQIGKVGPDQMKAALAASTDLAEGLGIDLQQAVEAVAKASEGQTKALHKMAPSLDEATLKGGNLADILAEIEKHFGGQAQAQLDTYQGRIKQLANDWDNVKEAIGGALANDASIKALLRGITDGLRGANKESEQFSLSQLLINQLIADGNIVFAEAVRQLDEYAKATNRAYEATRLLNKAKLDQGPPHGLLEEGNIDLLHRPRVKNKDGSTSTVLSFSVEIEGREVLLPLVSDLGKVLTEEQAIVKFNQDHKHLGIFDTPANADAYAQALHEQQAQMIAADKTAVLYTASLAEAQKAIAALTSEDKRNIAAAEAIHAKTENIVDALNREHPALKFTEAALQLYDDTLKKNVSTSEKARKALDDQRDSLNFVKDELLKVADALGKVEDKNQALDFADEMSDLKGQLDQVENRINKVSDAETEWILGTQHLLVNKSTVVKQYFDGLVKQQEQSHKGWEQFAQDLDGLSRAFAELAQISGGTLSGVLSTLGKLVGAANLAVKSFDSITEGYGKLHDANHSLKDNIGGFAELASGILAAAAAAVQFGKALVDALTHSRPEQLQSSVLHDFGVSIGEDLGKVIADSAIKEFGGSFQAAQIGNLDKIIAAGGGITIQNLDKLEARLHDVFSLMQTGELTAAQGQKVLNDNFQTFVDFLGGDVDPALKEIIRLNKEFGTQSKAILDFVAKNASLAAGGFNKIVQNINAIPGTLNRIGPVAEATFGALLDGGKSVVDALAEMGPGLDAVEKALKSSGQAASGFLAQVLGWQDIVTKNKGVFDALSGTLDVLKGLNNAGALTNDAFAQLAATIDDAFTTLTSQGVASADALKLMQPQLQELWELEKDFGYSVDASTQALIDQAVAAGEVGEKHRSIQEQMLDLQKQELAVLTAIGTAFGVTIPNDISKTGNAFDKLGNKIDDAIAKIPENVHIPVKFDIPELPDNIAHGSAVPFSSGGLVPFLPKAFANGGMVPSEAMLKRIQPVYAAGGFFTPRGTDTVPAMLSPGEFVVSRRGVQSAGMPALRSINNGVPPSGGGGVSVHIGTVVIDGKPDHSERRAMEDRLADAIADRIPDRVSNGGARYGKWKRMTKELAK